MTDAATGLGALGALRVVRRRLWLVVLLTLLVTGAAVAYSVTSPDQFDATAQLEAVDETATQIDTQAGVEDPERKVNNITQLLRLDQVAQAVSRRLGLRLGTSELLDKLSTDVAPNSDIVSLTIRDERPRQAALIANAWIEEFTAFRKRQAAQRFDEAAVRAQQEYDQLSPEEKASVEGRDLLGQARRLRTEASLQTGGVRPVLRAAVPSSRAAPRPKLAAVVGFAIGLALALGAAFALELFDRRLKEEEDFEAVFGLPILASIPRPARRRAEALPGEDVGQAEGYGTLAANFRFSNLTDDLAVVMITSGGPARARRRSPSAWRAS